jgi:hypothetical protein
VNRRWLLVWLLRLTGAVEVLAFGAVVMPAAWMDAIHAWLGLGELPHSPVIDSQLRELSFCYGLHGVTLWVIAADVDRYRPLVVFTGALYLLTGVVFVAIDWSAGLPWWWVLGSGGGILPLGAAVLALARDGGPPAGPA